MSCNCTASVIKIARGSTFTCTLTLPETYDLTDAQQVWVTFAQNDEELFTIDKENLTINANVVTVRLSEAQTLSFESGVARMQLRAKTADEECIVQEPITEIKILEILKDGAIE